MALRVRTSHSEYGVRRSSASGDVYFNCHVTSQDYPIDVSCRFMGGRFSRYVRNPDKFGDHWHFDS